MRRQDSRLRRFSVLPVLALAGGGAPRAALPRCACLLAASVPFYTLQVKKAVEEVFQAREAQQPDPCLCSIAM